MNANLAAVQRKIGRIRKIITLNRGPEAISEKFSLMPSDERLLERTSAIFGPFARTIGSVAIAEKAAQLDHCDIHQMNRVVAICNCGSSGSLLLSSYLDGHDSVVLLPKHFGMSLYPFLERYASLPLRDKLLAYSVFWTEDPNYPDHYKGFFEEEPAFSAADYFAAVAAFCQKYANCERQINESRRMCFVALHVVYAAACGRVPVSANPLMVYGQHATNDLLARRLVEDFPRARFIHTVRDPISNTSRLFERAYRDLAHEAAFAVLSHVSFCDAPHTGMEERTLTVRFEDLHLRLPETMSEVALWLALPFEPVLLESTFNGVPFKARRPEATWVGPRAAQAARDSRNIGRTDQYVLFAVLNEDFADWGYAFPRAFRYSCIRILTCLLLLPLPFGIELFTARQMLKLQVRELPRAVGRLCKSRIKIAGVLAAELCRRLILHKKVLHLAHATSGRYSSAADSLPRHA
jgi:Sulfotransferase family